jgi:hypothetical protein
MENTVLAAMIRAERQKAGIRPPVDMARLDRLYDRLEKAELIGDTVKENLIAQEIAKLEAAAKY